MTKTNMDLSELLAKHDQGDFLRSIAEAVLQLIMEADVDGLIAAGRHERSGERTTWRNGYRDRALDTRPAGRPDPVPVSRGPARCQAAIEASATLSPANCSAASMSRSRSSGMTAPRPFLLGGGIKANGPKPTFDFVAVAASRSKFRPSSNCFVAPPSSESQREVSGFSESQLENVLGPHNPRDRLSLNTCER